MVLAQELIDLLWREHPRAPQGGSRGPRARRTTSDAVDAAVRVADREGLAGVTVRRVAADLGVSPMSLYTHVDSREDLLALMADSMFAAMAKPRYRTTAWRARVRRIAEANLALHTEHAWLLDITDQRVALGPGAITKYDYELHAFDSLRAADLDRDAALTLVLDFTRSSARSRRPDPHAADMGATWAAWHTRLAAYLGTDYPLAQRVGAAAGAAQGGAYSAEHAWRFGLARLLDSLAHLTRPDHPKPDHPRDA